MHHKSCINNITLLSLLLMATFHVNAGIINPDCDLSDAAKSAAAEATIGVSGRCDTKEAMTDTVDKAADSAKEAVNDKIPDDGLAGKAVDAITPEEDPSLLKKAGKAAIN